MTTHDTLTSLLKSSAVLQTLGFGDDIWFAAKGANHHELIVISKASWKLPCSDANCGFEGVFLHFEYERPGSLLLHCELYPRQGSEANHPRDQIEPLLQLKGGIAKLVRDAATENGWSGSMGWQASNKDLSDPKNLQVGKFLLGLENDEPGSAAAAIERIVKAAAPTLDPIMSS